MPNTSGTYILYLTGIPLPPGDLNQDGVINNTDLTLLTDIFKKPSSQITAADLKLADVNYDGYVDNFDLSLILQSLSIRYDE
jgi:Ca2+-binding EF-hand superfamily protein